MDDSSQMRLFFTTLQLQKKAQTHKDLFFFPCSTEALVGSKK